MIYKEKLKPCICRTNGLGIGITSSRIGSILAPYILNLQYEIYWLPNTIFGVLGTLFAAAMTNYNKRVCFCDKVKFNALVWCLLYKNST